MSLFSLILIAIALAMDSFAVSISTGIALKRVRMRPMVKISFLFGLFQGVMPIIGWSVGYYFEPYIKQFDHWIAFLLLSAIGGKIIWETLKKSSDSIAINPYCICTIATLALATSIDALAIGISFSLLDDEIFLPSFIIGVVTFIFSLLGLFLGIKLVNICTKRIALVGGIILIVIGFKILYQHLATCC